MGVTVDKRTVAEAVLLRAGAPGPIRAIPITLGELDQWVVAAAGRYGPHLRAVIAEQPFTRSQWLAAHFIAELWHPELAEPAEGWPGAEED